MLLLDLSHRLLDFRLLVLLGLPLEHLRDLWNGIFRSQRRDVREAWCARWHPVVSTTSLVSACHSFLNSGTVVNSSGTVLGHVHHQKFIDRHPGMLLDHGVQVGTTSTAAMFLSQKLAIVQALQDCVSGVMCVLSVVLCILSAMMFVLPAECDVVC